MNSLSPVLFLLIFWKSPGQLSCENVSGVDLPNSFFMVRFSLANLGKNTTWGVLCSFYYVTSRGILHFVLLLVMTHLNRSIQICPQSLSIIRRHIYFIMNKKLIEWYLEAICLSAFSATFHQRVLASSFHSWLNLLLHQVIK